jgi:AcrR family transcriptional regulator
MMIHKAISARRAPKTETGIRREQIAQAALEIVAAEGLKRLSIAAVARRVGFVPSAVYRHYRGKEEILDAALDLLGARLDGIVAEAGTDGGDALTALHGILLRHARLMNRFLAVPRVLFSEAPRGLGRRRKARVQALLGGYLGRIAETVRRGQRAGQIARGRDPQTVALMFMGLIVPAGALWHMSGGAFDIEVHVERAWRIFRRAIAAR